MRHMRRMRGWEQRATHQMPAGIASDNACTLEGKNLRRGIVRALRGQPLGGNFGGGKIARPTQCVDLAQCDLKNIRLIPDARGVPAPLRGMRRIARVIRGPGGLQKRFAGMTRVAGGPA